VKCKEASQLVSQSLDRRLPWHQRILLRAHLLICDACTQFKRQMELLRAAAQRYAGEELRLTPATRQRIERALRDDSHQ
jgi:hypothetical protein